MRASNFSFVFQNYTGHLNFIDTDCYYHLRRLVHFIENFPRIMQFDSTADWPTGGPVDWPEGFLLMLGIPLKILGVSNFRQLEMGVCMLMMVLGIISCAAIVLAAQRLFRNIYFSIFCLFLASTNFLLIRFSCLGQVDHHIVEAIFPCLIFYLTDMAFLESNPKFSRSAKIALSLLIPFSFLISSSSIFGVGTFFAIYALVYGTRENLKSFVGIVLTAVLLITPYALWRGFAFNQWAVAMWPSFFQVSLLIFLALLSSVFVTMKHRLWIPIGTLLGSAAFVWFLEWPRVLFEPIHMAIHYVFGKGGVLQNVSEAAPIYRSFDDYRFDFMLLNFGFFIWILPAAWFALIYWKRWSLTERAFLLWFSMLTIPGITQKRFSHLMVGGFIIFLGWVAFRMFESVQPRIRKWAPLGCSLLLVGTTLPLFLYGLAPAGSPRDRVDLGISYLFLDKTKIEPETAWNRLAGREVVSEGIWTNPNLGHMLQYFTGLGVVVNSFYHGSGFELDYKLRTITDDDQLRAALKENRIRYAILPDDFAFMDLQYRLHRQPKEQLTEVHFENGRRIAKVNIEKASKLAWARFVVQEWVPTDFERLFSTRFDEAHYYSFVRGFKFTGF